MREPTPTIRQRKVARALRAWRNARDLKLKEVSARIGWSDAKISRLENAVTIAGPAEVIVLATIYGISEAERDEYVALAQNGDRVDWLRRFPADLVPGTLKDYIELEAEATQLDNFETTIVPGLLQTERYAKAIARGWELRPSDDVVEDRTALRVQRQARLQAERPLRLHAVIYEPGLRAPVGGTETMRAQLLHLVEMAELPNVTIQVLRAIGAHPAMGVSFCLLHLGEHTAPVAYTDALTRGVFVEEEDDVERCRLTFQRLTELALEPQESVDLIAQIAQGHS
ncbi:helix-turn-helix domain-containing protein [Streptoalloteichus hindustanus]|uniref:Helix-turn-helix domain-containing protein n=1 Tax=Streptoalloteichus hindustanus TaxID=2017 RepID=A0A1M5DAK5_STRHI|nr:helix-turn-helix transcriptional regulator [Streptoalloteichus hindustanus]SHF63984.1 Helix-turn-helix domain-containing protein [Streptoalloteichus hindustanus]